MPSLRQSYSVTVPEEPPAAAFPFLRPQERRKGSVSGSALVSTFVGLILHQARVRPAGARAPPAPGARLCNPVIRLTRRGCSSCSLRRRVFTFDRERHRNVGVFCLVSVSVQDRRGLTPPHKGVR